MTDATGVAALARVLADRSRAAMCLAMLDGSSWTVTELVGPPPAPASSLRAVGARRRLAAARTCYDHLAGRLGVAVMDALQDRGLVDPAAGLALTSRGERWFEELEIDIAELRSQRRAFVRECVDWTERRPHLAGSLGAALCDRFQELQWVRRPDRTRRLEVTAPGQRALHNLLGVEPADLVVIV